MGSSMHLTINGERKEWQQAAQISALLQSMAVDGRKVAVEVNQMIIPKSQYDSYQLNDNDIIEIVGFIGGG